MESVLDYISLRVIEDRNNSCCASYAQEEVDKAPRKMHLHKAPSPNEVNLFVYIVGLC